MPLWRVAQSPRVLWPRTPAPTLTMEFWVFYDSSIDVAGGGVDSHPDLAAGDAECRQAHGRVVRGRLIHCNGGHPLCT